MNDKELAKAKHDGKRPARGRPLNEEPSVRVAVRLPQYLFEELETMATERCITRSDVLRKLLEQAAEWRKK